MTPLTDREVKETIDFVDVELKMPDWRFGPAQLWYDMLNVSETGEEFDYGFKIKEVGWRLIVCFTKLL